MLGPALAAHPRWTSFVHRIDRGGKQLVQAASGDLTRLSLELGGKSPVLIFDDADLELAVPGAADAIFSNAGQVCVAGSRIYAQRGVYDLVAAGLTELARSLRLGPGPIQPRRWAP